MICALTLYSVASIAFVACVNTFMTAPAPMSDPPQQRSVTQRCEAATPLSLPGALNDATATTSREPACAEWTLAAGVKTSFYNC